MPLKKLDTKLGSPVVGSGSEAIEAMMTEPPEPPKHAHAEIKA